MSAILLNVLRETCPNISGNMRLALHVVALKAALRQESPELFNEDGLRNDSRTPVLSGQVWIRAEEMAEGVKLSV